MGVPTTTLLTGALLLGFAHAGLADPLAHTYSIVARDPATGQLGVAVQSHWLGVGALVAHAQPGVGAVATQAKTDVAYGPLGLLHLASGAAPAEAYGAVAAGDREPMARQVAMVDARGRVFAHTGSACIPAAGHELGEGFAVQANMMLDDGVVPAMARAYRAATGSFAERLLAALAGAEAAGGDLRGAQAAAIRVVEGTRPEDPRASGVLVDLRVDDHRDPVGELRRLLGRQRVLETWFRAAARVRGGDVAGGLAAFRAGVPATGENTEARFWFALTLAEAGQEAAASRMLAPILVDEAWSEVLRRLPGTSAMPAAGARDLADRLLAGR